jgi:hypothetical protein
MISQLKKKTIMAGAVGAVMAMTAAPSYADLTATAKLVIRDFTINGADGSTPLDASDFASLSFTSSADMDGALTGTAGFGFNTPNAQENIDFASSCVSTTGDCNPLPENGFPHITGPQGSDFVAADQMQLGSPISNLPNFVAAAGANVGQQASGSLSTTNAEGTANVNNGLESSFIFSLLQEGTVTFAGNVETYLEAFASAGELSPGKASAATSFTITITDLTLGGLVVYSFAPDLLNETTSVNPDGFGIDIQTCGTLVNVLGTCGVELATSFSDTTGVLIAGNLYQLSLRSNANIDIARVSAPGTLALLGLGLMGLARRRNNKR